MPATSTGRPWPAYAMLAASMVMVGSYVALSKPLVAAIPLFALAFLRFAIAALAMLPWTLPRADEAPLAPRERLSAPGPSSSHLSGWGNGSFWRALL